MILPNPTMSWLARSIAQSLRIDDEDDSDDDHHRTSAPNPNYHHRHREELLQHQQEEDEGNGSEIQDGGVKDDLSELKETLTRQLWGVASFLAPPPPTPPPPPRFGPRDPSVSDRTRWESSGSGDVSDEDASDSIGDSGTRTDFADTGGGFRTGISHFSNFLPFGSEEDQIGGAVGVTEAALAFARNIAHHPETWLDFPLEEEDIDVAMPRDGSLEH